MKKVIYIIAMALCLSACCFTGEIERKESDIKKEYLHLKGAPTLNIVRFEYDGHKYILFTSSETKNGCVHDPDCPCHELYINKGKTSDYPDWW